MRCLIGLLSLSCSSLVFADGDLSDNIRFSSEALGYDLQYRVYEPEGTRRNAETADTLYYRWSVVYLPR